MKKALSAVLAVVLVLSVCFSVPMIASANDTDPFTYQLNANGKGYTIIDVDENVTGVVTIPATYTIKDSEGYDTTGVVKPLSEINKANGPAAPVINITEPVNGTITATAKTGEEAARAITNGTVVVTNDEIVFTVTPNDGYKVGTFTVGGEVAELTGNTYTTTATDDITVAATFVVDQTQTFDVSVETSTNGEVTADPVKAYVDQVVTLTAEPAEGYKLAGVTVSDIEAEDLTITGNTCKFNMINKDVTVTATFTKLPVIAVTSTNGTVEAKNAQGEVITFAEAGTTGITLTAKPATGYELDGEITVEPASAYVDGVLTMPETGVTVTANFELADYKIDLNDVVVSLFLGLENGQGFLIVIRSDDAVGYFPANQ